MKYKWTWIALIVAAVALPTVAFAGFQSSVQVSCSANATTGSCSGMLGAARNSPDSVQRIQCDTRGASSGTLREAFCQATTSAGVTRSCVTTSSAMIDAAAAVSGDTYVLFSYNSGQCTSIRAINTSYAPPH